jgi:hypothetical protein
MGGKATLGLATCAEQDKPAGVERQGDRKENARYRVMVEQEGKIFS